MGATLEYFKEQGLEFMKIECPLGTFVVPFDRWVDLTAKAREGRRGSKARFDKLMDRMIDQLIQEELNQRN